jgi:hypothetical protein
MATVPGEVKESAQVTARVESGQEYKLLEVIEHSLKSVKSDQEGLL